MPKLSITYNTLGLKDAVTLDSPAVQTAYLLYTEEESFIQHRSFTTEHYVGVFTDFNELNEFTGRVFNLPYISVCDNPMAPCPYIVKRLPLFGGMDFVKKYADQLKDDILHPNPFASHIEHISNNGLVSKTIKTKDGTGA